MINSNAATQAFEHAFTVARRLSPKGPVQDVVIEYVAETAPLFLAAGLTEQEAAAYSARIWQMVMLEAGQ